MADPNCLTKALYKKKAWAKKALLESLYARGVALRVYHCRDCGGYHLTSKNV